MRSRKVWVLAASAGILVGLVGATMVARRSEWVMGFMYAKYGQPCAQPKYDHVALLAAIDETDKRAARDIALLKGPEAKHEPLAPERIAYLESKRSHLQILTDVLTKYIRGGHVKRVQCMGDDFLSHGVYYPSFSQIEDDRQAARFLMVSDKIERFSGITTLIALLSAVLGPLTTVLIFVLNGRREKKKAERLITIATPPDPR